MSTAELIARCINRATQHGWLVSRGHRTRGPRDHSMMEATMRATPDAWICWEHDVESADPAFPARHTGCPVGALHYAVRPSRGGR
jgi:hypothetical protein